METFNTESRECSMSLNQLFITGNLTRAPETKNLPSGSTVTEFGVALNRKWKTDSGEMKEEVCFLDVSAWGKTGENIAKFFDKGKPILLQGRIKQDNWTAQDGTKRSKITMIAESFQFVGGRDDGDRQDERPAQSNPQQSSRPAAARAGRAAMANPIEEEPVFDPAEIPF